MGWKNRVTGYRTDPSSGVMFVNAEVENDDGVHSFSTTYSFPPDATEEDIKKTMDEYLATIADPHPAASVIQAMIDEQAPAEPAQPE